MTKPDSIIELIDRFQAQTVQWHIESKDLDKLRDEFFSQIKSHYKSLVLSEREIELILIDAMIQIDIDNMVVKNPEPYKRLAKAIREETLRRINDD